MTIDERAVNADGWRRASCRTGAVSRRRAASPCEIGLIAVATDHAIELELRLFLPPERATVYVTRVALPDRYDLASLRATAVELSAAAALLVPGSPLDVLAYGCTSATVAIGEAAVFERLRRERPGIPCTTPITAAMAAFARLGVARWRCSRPILERSMRRSPPF